jgi:hypothetical protein
MIPEPMERSTQNRAPISHQHKHCIQTDWNKIFFEQKPWGKKPPGGLKYKQTKVQQNV